MLAVTNLILALMVGLGPQQPVGDVPDADVLDLAISGYGMAVASGVVPPSSLLTIIDYSKPSTEKRLYVVDPASEKILHASLVAHGKNTGQNIASVFSNKSGSLRSSLGFFLTGEPYYGKHGYSLRLHGLEKGINDNAYQRNIVIHGADYVSQEFALKHGRLGRSWGCPALPEKTTRMVIDRIKSGTCVFIYGTDSTYRRKSHYTSAQ